MAIFATSGPFIYLYIQRRAEERLLQEQIRYQTTLRQASSGMGRVKDIKRLVNLVVHILTRTIRLEHSVVYLQDETKIKYLLKASKGRKLRFQSKSEIDGNSVVVQYLMKTREPVVYEEIAQRTQDYGDRELARLEAELKELKAAVVVPSFIDDRLLAVIVLGAKVTGKLFSDEDLAVFSILANQAALAIENAQFYEDMKRTQEQLFKAEKMATIGIMADGLSHQINNRLHALGFIAGDIMDTIKMKRAAFITPEAQSVIVDIEHALVRIEENVARGGEVVRGLLKYTRKGESGFSPVDLNELISSAQEMTQFKIKPGEMQLVRAFPSDLPKIKGNFTQLQEVFFNLIDNAYDAMMQRRAECQEPGYKAVINISARYNEAGMIDILVEDNGIGVKSEDNHKLFTPFFTTKLSSRKGTGLGLYVIQKLIVENHGGKVAFASEYKKGTRIHITLPISH